MAEADEILTGRDDIVAAFSQTNPPLFGDDGLDDFAPDDYPNSTLFNKFSYDGITLTSADIARIAAITQNAHNSTNKPFHDESNTEIVFRYLLYSRSTPVVQSELDDLYIAIANQLDREDDLEEMAGELEEYVSAIEQELGPQALDTGTPEETITGEEVREYVAREAGITLDVERIIADNDLPSLADIEIPINKQEDILTDAKVNRDLLKGTYADTHLAHQFLLFAYEDSTLSEEEKKAAIATVNEAIKKLPEVIPPSTDPTADTPLEINNANKDKIETFLSTLEDKINAQSRTESVDLINEFFEKLAAASKNYPDGHAMLKLIEEEPSEQTILHLRNMIEAEELKLAPFGADTPHILGDDFRELLVMSHLIERSSLSLNDKVLLQIEVASCLPEVPGVRNGSYMLEQLRNGNLTAPQSVFEEHSFSLHAGKKTPHTALPVGDGQREKLNRYFMPVNFPETDWQAPRKKEHLDQFIEFANFLDNHKIQIAEISGLQLYEMMKQAGIEAAEFSTHDTTETAKRNHAYQKTLLSYCLKENLLSMQGKAALLPSSSERKAGDALLNTTINLNNHPAGYAAIFSKPLVDELSGSPNAHKQGIAHAYKLLAEIKNEKLLFERDHQAIVALSLIQGMHEGMMFAQSGDQFDPEQYAIHFITHLAHEEHLPQEIIQEVDEFIRTREEKQRQAQIKEKEAVEKANAEALENFKKQEFTVSTLAENLQQFMGTVTEAAQNHIALQTRENSKSPYMTLDFHRQLIANLDTALRRADYALADAGQTITGEQLIEAMRRASAEVVYSRNDAGQMTADTSKYFNGFIGYLRDQNLLADRGKARDELLENKHPIDELLNNFEFMFERHNLLTMGLEQTYLDKIKAAKFSPATHQKQFIEEILGDLHEDQRSIRNLSGKELYEIMQHASQAALTTNYKSGSNAHTRYNEAFHAELERRNLVMTEREYKIETGEIKPTKPIVKAVSTGLGVVATGATVREFFRGKKDPETGEVKKPSTLKKILGVCLIVSIIALVAKFGWRDKVTANRMQPPQTEMTV